MVMMMMNSESRTFKTLVVILGQVVNSHIDAVVGGASYTFLMVYFSPSAVVSLTVFILTHCKNIITGMGLFVLYFLTYLSPQSVKWLHPTLGCQVYY